MTDREGRYADMRQDVARVATEALKEAGQSTAATVIQALMQDDLKRAIELLNLRDSAFIDELLRQQAQIDELREKLKGLGGV